MGNSKIFCINIIAGIAAAGEVCAERRLMLNYLPNGQTITELKMKALSQPRNLYLLSIVLSAIGLLDSLYLWYTKVTKTEFICGVGECDVVNASPYSSLLGVPVAALGAAGYAALLILAVWAFVAKDNAPTWLASIRLGLAGGGLFFAAYLTVIELLVIHAI